MLSTTEEIKFISILGMALKAGNDATTEWDSNDWFPCGAGHVLVKPRNSKFAKWLVTNGNDFSEASMVSIHDADYKRAVIISTYQFNQAMNPQLIWASAVAKALRAADIRAEMWSYID